MGHEITSHDSKKEAIEEEEEEECAEKEAIEEEWRVWLRAYENQSNSNGDMSFYEKLQNLIYQSVEGEYWEIVVEAYEKVPLARKTTIPNCNPGNQTALHLLVGRSTAIKVVKEVLTHVDGDVVKMKDERGNTVLHAAAAKGILNIDTCKLIHSFFPDLIEECNDEGKTALSLLTSGLIEDPFSGSWNTVVDGYEDMINILNITTLPLHSTPLHMAIYYSLSDKEDPQKTFEQVQEKENMLMIKDEMGNTALHLAASIHLMKDLCKSMADACPQLVNEANCDGETPLFIAARSVTIDTFRNLSKYADPSTIDRPRGDGNTIFHSALLRGDFEMVYHILQKNSSFRSMEGKDGLTPLEILVNKPSAFKSRTPLTMVEHIIYSCIWVVDLEKSDYNEIDYCRQALSQCFNTAKRLIMSGPQMMYEVLLSRSCYSRESNNPKDESELAKDLEKSDREHIIGAVTATETRIQEPRPLRKCLSNYYVKCMVPIDRFIKTCMVLIKYFFKTCIAPFMIVNNFLIKHLLPGELVRKIEIIKRRHMLAYKIMEKLLDYEASSKHPLFSRRCNATILIAAEKGVTEIVRGILKINPRAATIPTTNNLKNAMLVAIENRQADVYELLTNFEKKGRSIAKWGKDLEENNALHLAATSSFRQPWGMPKSLRLLWEIKWYNYVRDSMPPDFSQARNKVGKTPADVFNETHKEQIKSLEGGGEWVNKTSQSCSVVASLITTVAFHAATTVPGGNSDKGAPNFLGKAAFSTFVISTFVALCLSLTSLIMFLTILISPYHDSEDLGRSLPEQLIGGISALLGSIGAMLISFWAAHIFFLKEKLMAVALPIYILVCLPILGTVKAQISFYINLVLSLYRAKPRPWYAEFTT